MEEHDIRRCSTFHLLFGPDADDTTKVASQLVVVPIAMSELFEKELDGTNRIDRVGWLTLSFDLPGHVGNQSIQIAQVKSLVQVARDLRVKL